MAGTRHSLDRYDDDPVDPADNDLHLLLRGLVWLIACIGGGVLAGYAWAYAGLPGAITVAACWVALTVVALGELRESGAS